MAHEPVHSAAHDLHDHGDHKETGFWRRWVMTTNHKDIGTLYLVFSCIMFFVGGTMAMLIRAELFKPGMQFLDPATFNAMTTGKIDSTGRPGIVLSDSSQISVIRNLGSRQFANEDFYSAGGLTRGARVTRIRPLRKRLSCTHLSRRNFTERSALS